MTEQMITFKTAKLAKEKKFNWKVRQVYDNNGKKIDVISHTNKSNQLIINNTSHIYNICSAPTQSLLQKWLREKHNIYVTSKPYIDDVSNETDENIKFQILWENEIVDVKDSYNVFSDYTYYHNYEEALEIGLQEGLKLII